MDKKDIILLNESLGIETKFFSDPLGVHGYTENGVVYLNEAYMSLKMVNKHEIMHLYEETTAFKLIKESLLNMLNSDELKSLHEEYQLRYAGLYSAKEIEDGILDTEIAIDMIIDNGEFSKEIKTFCENMFEIITNGEKAPALARRYLNLTFSTKIEQKFPQATTWEKIFIQNFYDGKEHQLPTVKETKYQVVRRDILKELEALYAYTENKENFRIYINNNPELEREFQSEIKALRARGEGRMAQFYLDHRKEAIKEFAHKIAKTHQEEFKHIVDFIKSTEYEPAFKALILRETLLKTYKLEKDKNGEKTIVHKREEHRSLAGHMTLNEDVLRVIYNNLQDYTNFANLYFAGLAVFNKKTTEKSRISLDGIDTFSMGKWLKFEGKASSEKDYIKNAQNLASLVQNTPWCTKTLASSQLEQGDFFVFVDNDGQPHVAVKMNGQEIDEVRGLKNGNAQELEDDYRTVAIEFLTKNKDIKYGKEWLEKEEWNARLIHYSKEIKEGNFKNEEVEQFLFDLFTFKNYKSHGIENSNIKQIIDYLKTDKFPQGLDFIAKYFNCKKEEIHLGGLNLINSSNEKIQLLNKKTIILGNVVCGMSNKSLGSIQYIYGDATFTVSNLEDLGKLKRIHGNASFYDCQIASLGNLKVIDGNASFSSFFGDLGNLRVIGGNGIFFYSGIKNLGNLEYIGGNANFEHSSLTSLNKLKRVKGSLVLKNSKITHLGELSYVGGTLELTEEQEVLFANKIYKDKDGNWRLKNNLKIENEEEIENN